MQRLEVSSAVRPLWWSLCIKGLITLGSNYLSRRTLLQGVIDINRQKAMREKNNIKNAKKWYTNLCSLSKEYIICLAELSEQTTVFVLNTTDISNET